MFRRGKTKGGEPSPPVSILRISTSAPAGSQTGPFRYSVARMIRLRFRLRPDTFRVRTVPVHSVGCVLFSTWVFPHCRGLLFGNPDRLSGSPDQMLGLLRPATSFRTKRQVERSFFISDPLLSSGLGVLQISPWVVYLSDSGGFVVRESGPFIRIPRSVVGTSPVFNFLPDKAAGGTDVFHSIPLLSFAPIV